MSAGVQAQPQASLPAPAASREPGSGASRAGAGAAVPVPAPAPSPGPVDERTARGVIAGARERIDDLDGRIIELIKERIGVSEEVQRARMAAGGRRLSLNREMEILTRYSDALGKPGTPLAMTLLELCRGRI